MTGRRSAIAPIVIGVVGTAILLFLGTWQVQRLDWKQGLISEIEVRMVAAPVALPAAVAPERDNLLRVAVNGRLAREELHVLHSIKLLGPGFRVIAPMELAPEGGGPARRIMVDLGFVPEDRKALQTRPNSVRLTERGYTDEVVGFLNWPMESDGYTPEPDLDKGIWFARDVVAMAAELKTEPLLIVAERHPDGDWPRALPPGVDLPNRHLEYAATWFMLALVWSMMSIIWLRAELRKPRG